MNNKIQYSCNSYNVIKATLIALLIFSSSTILVIVIGRYLHNTNFIYAFVFVLIFPFIFQKQYKNLFTNKIDIEFDNKSLIINEYNHKVELIKEIQIQWSEIENYKFSFSTSMTDFTLKLKNGSKKHYLFNEEMTQEQAINGKSFFSIFYYYIKQYNIEKRNEEIALKPGFFTTRLGSFIIFSICCLVVFGIIINYFINPKTFKFSFMSFFIILGILAKRKSDKNFHELVNQLEPRNPNN
jgi:hypothetical protein